MIFPSYVLTFLISNVKTLLFFLLFSFSFYDSQIPGLINYNEKDGLNASFTYTVTQDKKGFIWIGSSNGLFRFNGIEFKQYSRKNGLKNIDVLECTPLSNGEIFIVPFLNDFAYLKGNKIINSDKNPELRKIKSGFGSPWIRSYRNELIFCNNSNPTTAYLYENGKIKEIPIAFNYNQSEANVIDFNFSTHTLYLKEGNIIISYNIYNKKKTVLYTELVPEEIIVSVRGNVYISKKNNTISIYLKTGNSLKKIQSYTSPDTVHHVLIDRNDKMWIVLENGGVLYFDEPLSNSHTLDKHVKLLDQYFVNSILVDQDKNIWISSRQDGLFFINAASFRSYLNLPLRNNSSYITCIAANSKNIFLGYNSANGGIYNSHGLNNLSFTKNRKLENKSVYANEKFIYFGHPEGLFEYNLTTRKIHLYNLFFGIKNIVAYDEKHILVCGFKSLERHNIVSHLRETLWKERTYTALPLTKDSIFAGTFKDLYKLNIITKKSTLFLEGYYFSDIKKIKNNLYIGATNLKGIVLFDNKKIIRDITENNGLIDNQIKRIDVENDHIFWASTNSGLVRIDIKNSKKPQINNFTFIDGLPSNKVAGCIIRGDSIFVGTSKGLGIFSLKKLLTQQKYITKKVIINSVIIGGKEYFDVYHTISGKSPKNDVVINLSFLDYSSQGKIEYKYKIEGLNDTWETTSSPKIILSSLPPGKYNFKVYGIGYNGKQSLNYTQLPFEIFPCFWQTVWFRALVVLLSILFLFVILNTYYRKKRHKKLRDLFNEKKIAELELQAIKAQINPHFIYNCLNSIKFLLYKKDVAEAENYLKVFSQMIRKTLIYSEKTFMPIKEEIEYLTLYLEMEQLRLKENFSYEITVSEDVNLQWSIPSLLVQPFVENAIKHGISNLQDRKGLIKISFEYENATLFIIIEDNGVGFTDQSVLTEKIHSFGVKLSQKRIETFKQLFNTKITLEINRLSETKQKSGTEIKIIIPHEHTNPNLHH